MSQFTDAFMHLRALMSYAMLVGHYLPIIIARDAVSWACSITTNYLYQFTEAE